MATRGLAALVTVLLTSPSWGETEAETFDGEIGVEGGTMTVIQDSGCGWRALPASHAGISGRLRYQTAPTTGPYPTRAVFGVGGNLRAISVGGSKPDGVIGIGRASFGVALTTAELRIGGWVGNPVDPTYVWGGPSLALRIGPPDRNVTLFFLDGPSCFIGNCWAGAEFTLGEDGVRLELGASVGSVEAFYLFSAGDPVTAYRATLTFSARLGKKLPWLMPGLELGHTSDGQDTWVLALRLGWPER